MATGRKKEIFGFTEEDTAQMEFEPSVLIITAMIYSIM